MCNCCLFNFSHSFNVWNPVTADIAEAVHSYDLNFKLFKLQCLVLLLYIHRISRSQESWSSTGMPVVINKHGGKRFWCAPGSKNVVLTSQILTWKFCSRVSLIRSKYYESLYINFASLAKNLETTFYSLYPQKIKVVRLFRESCGVQHSTFDLSAYNFHLIWHSTCSLIIQSPYKSLYFKRKRWKIWHVIFSID